MTKILSGTSGYSYKEWKGEFYPEKIAAADMLEYYATQLPTVEINNTFYRLPKRDVVTTWSDQVPEDFRFVMKASRRITHMKRLRDCRDEIEYMLDVFSTAGPRLGAVLFQLPPNFKADLERLDDFLDDIPGGTRAAFEFRHDTWKDDAVVELLRKRGFALCAADTEDDPGEFVATTDWGYARLRRPGYTDKDLKKWIAQIEDSNCKEVFVFFKHEDTGAGPEMARRFLKLAGD